MVPDRVWVVTELLEYMSTHESWINDPQLRSLTDNRTSEQLHTVVTELKEKRSQLHNLERQIFVLEKDKFDLEEIIKEERQSNERSLVSLLKVKFAHDEQLQMELEEKLREHEAELARMARRVDTEVRIKEEAVGSEKRLRGDVHRLELTLDTSEKQILQLRENERNLRGDVHKLELNLSVADKEIHKLRDMERSFRSELECVTSKYQTEQNTALKMREAEHLLRSELEALQARAQSEQQAVQAALQQKRDSERALIIELEQVKQKYELTETDCFKLQDMERRLNTEIDLLQRNVSEMENKLAGEGMKLAQSQADVINLKEQNGVIMAQSDSLRVTLAALENTMTAQTEELRHVKTAESRTHEERQRLWNDVNKLTDENQALIEERKKLTFTHDECNRLLTEIGKLRDENNGIIEERERLRDELAHINRSTSTFINHHNGSPPSPPPPLMSQTTVERQQRITHTQHEHSSTQQLQHVAGGPGGGGGSGGGGGGPITTTTTPIALTSGGPPLPVGGGGGATTQQYSSTHSTTSIHISTMSSGSESPPPTLMTHNPPTSSSPPPPATTHRETYGGHVRTASPPPPQGPVGVPLDQVPVVGIELSEGKTYGIDGVCVVAVKDGGPAAGGGIMEGDIITTLNDNSVGTREDFKEIIRSCFPGDTITFILFRGAHPHRQKLLGNLTLGSASKWPSHRRNVVRRMPSPTGEERTPVTLPHNLSLPPQPSPPSSTHNTSTALHNIPVL